MADLLSRLSGLRELGLSRFAEMDRIEAFAPDGALYFYGRLTDGGGASLDVAERLLADAKVACMPGEPFGSPGHLRFNFAVERDILEEGLERIAGFFG